jgi:hypothetical protein
MVGGDGTGWAMAPEDAPIVCREGALDMIDMITAALDVGIMTGLVMFVAFGLVLRP